MPITTHKFLPIVLTLLAACGGQAEPPDGDEETTAGDEETGVTGETGEPCVEDPKEPVELLNACSDASCEPFANTPERLPLLEADGSLPPLP